MTNDRPVQHLIDEVDELERLLKNQRKTEHSRSQTLVGIIAGFSLCALVLVALNYYRLRTEWSEERFRGSLEQQLEELAPGVTGELEVLSSALIPVMTEEGRRQLPGRWPNIQSVLATETKELQKSLVMDFQNQLTGLETSVGSRLESEIFQAFPTLDDPLRRQELLKYYDTTCQEAMVKAVTNFHSRFEGRLHETAQSVAEIDSAAHTQTETVELHKRFIQLWLELLQEEITQR